MLHQKVYTIARLFSHVSYNPFSMKVARGREALGIRMPATGKESATLHSSEGPPLIFQMLFQVKTVLVKQWIVQKIRVQRTQSRSYWN